jgi:histidine ammonia-lyase
MTSTYTISNLKISPEQIRKLCRENTQLSLSAESKEKIAKSKVYLTQKLEQSKEPIYGINTGFGSLYNKKISKSDLTTLQENLVKSHACGTGEVVPEDIVRLMLFLKIQSLAYGHSGVRIELVERLIFMFNHLIHPVVYTQGSLGASGDLAPLAHLSLPLIGEGEVFYQSKRIFTAQLNQELNLQNLKLEAKEGLALLNGTQFMLAYGIWCITEGQKYLSLANMIGALAIDAYDGRPEPFYPELQQIRPHNGQIACAKEVLYWLSDSEIIKQKKIHVQDPYSFRCIPQVHGASYDALHYAYGVFETEANSVTDNPNIFPEIDQIISGGNFHGQALALPLDFLAIALAELGNISERRTYQLISGLRKLPPYLVKKPGLNSGLMIPQYTAASIVSENKQLCTPASVDSIVSSNGQEDHVSMGANAATKAFRVVNNLKNILAIEWLTACQALDFRRPLSSSVKLEEVYAKYRKHVSFIEEDRVLSLDIQETRRFLDQLDEHLLN